MSPPPPPQDSHIPKCRICECCCVAGHMAKGALRLQMRVRSLISWTLRKEILLGGLGAITHI